MLLDCLDTGMTLADYEWAVTEWHHGTQHVHTYDKPEQAMKAYRHYLAKGNGVALWHRGELIR